jgi:hypothetical protein
MRRWIGAFLWGTFAVFVGYCVTGFAMTLAVFAFRETSLLDAFRSNVAAQVVFPAVLAFPCALLGGFVTALLAGRRELLHATVTAGLFLVMFLFLLMQGAEQGAGRLGFLSLTLFFASLSVAQVAAGWLRARQRKPATPARPPL